MSILNDLLGGGDRSSQDVISLMNENKDLFKNLETPEYREFIPELYGNQSYNFETIGDDALTKSRQEQLLAEMAGLKDTGLSAVDEAGFNKARSMGNQMAKAGTGAAIQDAQNRGVAGSGMEFALREMAGQGGAQRAQEAGMQQAADSARQRALYSQAYGDALSGQRDQNYRQEAANTNIINDFNSKNTAQRNQTNNQNVDLRNQAFQYNQGLKDKTFNNQVTKINGQTGANRGIADAYAARGAAEQADQNALIGIGGQLGAAYLGRKK
jgi:hypothetical protein